MDNPPVFEIELPSFQADVVERSRRMPVVVLFWTDQVAPAAETKSVLERLAGQYQGKFALALSDIAKDQTLAQQLRVQAIPSIRVVKDGQIIEQMEGPQGENALRQLIDGLTQSPSDQLKTQLAAYLQAEDFDGALAVLQQAVQAEPGNTAFKVEWADVMLIQGDIEGGRTVLAAIPEDTADRQRPATRLGLLEEAADMGSLADALAAVASDETDLDARYRAAILLTRNAAIRKPWSRRWPFCNRIGSIETKSGASRWCALCPCWRRARMWPNNSDAECSTSCIDKDGIRK